MTNTLPSTSLKPKTGDKFIISFIEKEAWRTITNIKGFITDAGDMGSREIWMVEIKEYPNCIYEIAYDSNLGKWREWDGTF